MGIWDIFYPRRCVICDRILRMKEQEICSQCKGLPLLIGENFCMKCGKRVPEGQEYCEDCQSKKTTFLCGRSVFPTIAICDDQLQGLSIMEDRNMLLIMEE